MIGRKEDYPRKNVRPLALSLILDTHFWAACYCARFGLTYQVVSPMGTQAPPSYDRSFTFTNREWTISFLMSATKNNRCPHSASIHLSWHVRISNSLLFILKSFLRVVPLHLSMTYLVGKWLLMVTHPLLMFRFHPLLSDRHDCASATPCAICSSDARKVSPWVSNIMRSYLVAVIFCDLSKLKVLMAPGTEVLFIAKR